MLSSFGCAVQVPIKNHGNVVNVLHAGGSGPWFKYDWVANRLQPLCLDIGTASAARLVRLQDDSGVQLVAAGP